MANEYKFMFDRRFDEPEEIVSLEEDLSTKSVDGIPSISEILNTLNERMEITPETKETEEETPSEETADKLEIQADEALETENDETKEQPFLQGETVENVTLAQEIEQLPEQVSVRLPENIQTITDEEKEALKEIAFDEGKAAGLMEGRNAAWQEAMESIEKQNSDTLELIATSLKEFDPIVKNAANLAFSTALDFSMAVCRKIIPAVSEKYALEEIRDLLEKNFHFLKDEPKIAIRIHPNLAEKMKKYLAEIVKKESYGGIVAVLRDESLPLGDCRVEWKGGGLERKTEDILNQAEELVKLYKQTPPTAKARDEQTGEETNG